ncbi:MAG: hypothetical protein ABIR79_14595 [Candidatus Binatia bacterium]
MKRIYFAAGLLAAIAVTKPSFAADVHIGVNIVPPVIAFDAPPRLVVVPGFPRVHYAPDVSVNYFTYDDAYYTYDNGNWFVAHADGGPWSYVERRYVPGPVLRVPTRYYRVAPRVVSSGHWKGHSHRSYKHESSWHGDSRGHGKKNGHGKGHGNGHGNGKGHKHH